VGNTQRLPSLPEGAGFLHCRMALRFFGIAVWRFAFPALPYGASLFLHCRMAPSAYPAYV